MKYLEDINILMNKFNNNLFNFYRDKDSFIKNIFFTFNSPHVNIGVEETIIIKSIKKIFNLCYNNFISASYHFQSLVYSEVFISNKRIKYGE